MARSFWLVKSEPNTYAWDELVKDGSTYWDGVRNHAARGHMARMKKNDLVLYYHSGEGKEVVGIARVIRETYPDPTSDDPRWVVVDLAPVKPFAQSVTLKEIKAKASLSEIALVRQSRLSVMPLPEQAFGEILRMGGTKL